MTPPGPEPVPGTGPGRTLLRTLLGDRRAVTEMTGWALVGALPTLASGQAVARAVDQGFLAGRPLTGLAWLALLAATVPLGAWGARGTYAAVARVVEPLRDELVRTVVTGAIRRATATATPSDRGAVARLSQHVEIVRDTVAGLLLLVLGFVAGTVAALSGLSTLAPVVLPLVLAPLAVAAAAFAASLPALARQQRRLLQADERLADVADEVVAGLRDVAACGGEEVAGAWLDDCIEAHVAAGRALARLAAVRTIVVAVGARVPLVLVLLSSGWLLERGLSEGALIGTLTYLIQGLGPAVAAVVGGLGGPLAQLLVTLDCIDEQAVAPPGPTADSTADDRDRGRTGPADPSLLVRGVTFRYRAAAEPVVHGLDLDVPPGDHLAIVGPSGAGKSTLASLLVGVLEPQEGAILHGGCRASAVAAGHRVLIPQQAYVFRGTLGENLRYLHPEATPGEIDQALGDLGMRDLSERLGGPGATIEPARLSAGECQLVALARAYLAPARLVVLDEATCHLDPEAEATVEQAFQRRPGTTLVVVAHRLSSAQRARRVLLMDGCDVVVGSHDELVVLSRLYRDLVGHWLEPAPAG